MNTFRRELIEAAANASSNAIQQLHTALPYPHAPCCFSARYEMTMNSLSFVKRARIVTQSAMSRFLDLIILLRGVSSILYYGSIV